MVANVDATSSATKYARYVHQPLCLLPAATLLLALNKSTKLQAIPGFTSLLICSHLPKSTATNKGHMRRQCSNTASTRNKHADVVLARAKVNRMFPAHKACAVQDMFCFAALAHTKTSTIYSDLTGAFPLRQGRHECAHHKTIDHSNHIIKPCSTPAAKSSGNILLLLMIQKMKI
jgi:hypothetical protein